MANTSRVYVIGDSERGVVLLMVDPLRVATISKEEIDAFALTTGATPKNVLGQVAKAAMRLIAHSDLDPPLPADDPVAAKAFGDAVERGMNLSDAEFCFIADLDTGDWDTFRNNCIPIREAIKILGGIEKTPSGKAIPAQLVDF